MGIRRTWDFRCDSCGTLHASMLFFDKVPETVPCPDCGGTASWASFRSNGIHQTHTGRKYGEFDPQFGCVVEDYAHKKRLLKERGWEELPPESVDAIREEVDPTPTERDPNVVGADSIEELVGNIKKLPVDHQKTGNLDNRLKQWADDDSASPWAI